MSVDWFLFDRDLRHERVNENRDEIGQLKELWSEYLFFFLGHNNHQYWGIYATIGYKFWD